jgi:2-phospho-L-lactate guanylyltransferase
MSATAIIPIKSPTRSKSRLAVPDDLRRQLSGAFARDVLDAVAGASSVAQIVVVGGGPAGAMLAGLHAAVWLPEPRTAHDDGLNCALVQAREWAVEHRQASPVLVVPADLAALTSRALDDAVVLMSTHDSAFVPDAGGDGTTLTWVRTPGLLAPRYGPLSAHHHGAAGAYPARDVDRRARRDVDNVDDLREAGELGIGRHTQATLTDYRRSRDRATGLVHV